MGANVFFPDYLDKYDNKYEFCAPKIVNEERQVEGSSECEEQRQAHQEVYFQEWQKYNSWKYFFITIVNLLSILAIIRIKLDESIKLGLFSGAIATTFFATWIYFEAQSKPGFVVLGTILVASIYIINKKIKK